MSLHQSVHRMPGMILTERVFEVPLDHAAPDGERIEVFGRIATAPGGEDRPLMVYLTGGPGFEAPRPQPSAGPVELGGWLGRALQDYRVLLLDQRGTGRSMPLDRHSLPERGTPEQQAEFLACFRADSIVRDCELIRAEINDGEPWSVLGQSFGGFCVTTYLSIAPQGLSQALICGGLPGLDVEADGVYRAAYPRMRRASLEYYARYPEDVDRVRRIAGRLRETETLLPNGAILTAEAFQGLGIILGRAGGEESLHYIVESAFSAPGGGMLLRDRFLEQVHAVLSLAANPLYAVVHESIYGQGAPATAWSADRTRREFPEFDVDAALADPERPVLLTAEAYYPWHFDTDPALRPLRETAHALAERTDWPQLYDPAALAANEVPTAAVVYLDDLYVELSHSLRTADAIKGLRYWATNDYRHDGLRASGDVVIDRLLRMNAGAI